MHITSRLLKLEGALKFLFGSHCFVLFCFLNFRSCHILALVPGFIFQFSVSICHFSLELLFQFNCAQAEFSKRMAGCLARKQVNISEPKSGEQPEGPEPLKLHIKPHYAKCGSWTSSTSIPGNLLEMQSLRSHSDLLNPNLHF